jgi:pimeloyl-ACP methyl ester carboxylesterase
MGTVLTRLGTRLDTWRGEARMRRFGRGWPAKASDGVRFYRSAKVQHRYREAGAGPTIVFTADPPMTLENYDQLVETFARAFRVVVVELPAMGFSATTSSFGFGFRETNDELANFLSGVCGERSILAFSCVAGFAALDIAWRRPELASHLCLIQSGDMAAFARWKAARDPKGLLGRPVLGQLLMRRLAPRRMPAWYAVSVGRRERIPDFCACAARSFDHGAMWSLASAYQCYMAWRSDTPAPSQPLLSLWGAADKSHPPQNVHTLRTLRQDVGCVTFDDLGHTPELEDSRRVFTAIEAFVRANPA